MELVYICFFIIFTISFLINFLLIPSAIIITISATLCICYYVKQKNIKIIYIFFLCVAFIIRCETKVYKNELVEKTDYFLTINIEESKGEILKIENKYPKKRIFVSLKEASLKNGNYEAIGVLDNIDTRNVVYADLKIIDIKEKNSVLFKNTLRNKIEKLSKNYSYNLENFMYAVLLGEKSYLDEEILSDFSYTGTSHLIVISGLHIGIVIALVAYVLTLFYVPYQIKYILVGIILTIYCYTLGFSPSIQRAYIMGIMFVFSKIFYEGTDIKKSLSIAFIISNFINPKILSSISFQLSYMAVLSIVFIYSNLKPKNSNKILNFIFLSFSIQITLAPIFMYNFNIIPLFSFVINIIAIPLATVLINLLFISLLLSFLNLGFFIMPTIEILYQILEIYIEIVSKIPFLSIKMSNNINMVFVVYYYVILFLIIILGLNAVKRYAIAIINIGILIYFISFQKEATIYEYRENKFEKNDYNILIINDYFSDRDNFLLRSNGVKEIDIIISNSKINRKNIGKFDIIKFIQLKQGERININNKKYINRKGIIIEEPKIN